MDLFTLLHRTATAFGRFLPLARDAHHHRLLAALLRRLADPAHGERHTAHRAHFDRHLVVRAADAAALHFHDRLHVLHRLREHLDRVLARLRLDGVERAVDDPLGDRLLAARHQDVDELRQVDVVELRIRQDLALRYLSAAGHLNSLSGLRRLGAIFRTGLLAVLHALRVQRTAHDVIAHAGQVLHAAAADEHHRVLLQVVPFTADITDDLEAVGEADLGDLAKGRVRLLRGRRVHAGAHPALLRRARERRHLRFRTLGRTALAH